MQIDQDKLMVRAYYSRKYGMVKNLEQTLCTYSFETDERMICRDTMASRDGGNEGAGGHTPPNILAAQIILSQQRVQIIPPHYCSPFLDFQTFHHPCMG